MWRCRLCGSPLTANTGFGMDEVDFYPSRRKGRPARVRICLTCFLDLIEQNLDILSMIAEVKLQPKLELNRGKAL